MGMGAFVNDCGFVVSLSALTVGLKFLRSTLFLPLGFSLSADAEACRQKCRDKRRVQSKLIISTSNVQKGLLLKSALSNLSVSCLTL